MSLANFDPGAAFTQALDDELENYPPDAPWIISGRASTAHPHGEDDGWWRERGPGMVQAWVDWRAKTPWDIWVAPDGRPGIELGLEVVVNGELMKMFIDCVMATQPNNGRPVVVDVKSGAKDPDWYFQLAKYKVGIETMWPTVKVAGGAYWMARKGDVSGVVGLNHITPAYIAELARRQKAMRANGIYIPSVGSMCRTCSVGRFCAANDGSEAHFDPDFHLLGGTQ